MRTPSWPGTQLAIAASTGRPGVAQKSTVKEGEGSVRNSKTRTLRIPARYGLGKFAAPRQNPHVLHPGMGSTHPKGGSIGFGLVIREKGGARKR